MLEAVVPESVNGSPAFDAFLHALVRPLSTYIDWAGALLAEEEHRADAAHPEDKGTLPAKTRLRVPNQAPSSATQILADSQRLIAAVDDFVANPLADDVRSALVSLLNEVLRPALAATRPTATAARPIAAKTVAVAPVAAARQAPPPQAPPPTDESAKPAPADPDPDPVPDPSSGDPQQATEQVDPPEIPVSAQRLAAEQMDLHARPAPSQPVHLVEPQIDQGVTATSREIAADRRVPETPSAPSDGAPVRHDDAMTHGWQDRFEQLNRRMNVGFMLMGAVGLGLLALNLYETFSRPRLGIEVVEAMASRAEPVPALPAPAAPAAIAGMDLASFEALAQQLQASGEDIAALLAQWSSGPGSSVQTLEARMLAMEAEFTRLRVDLDAMGASFQVDAETYAMAEASETDPLEPPAMNADIDAQALTPFDPDGDAGTAAGVDSAMDDPDALTVEVAEADESMPEPILADGMITEDGLVEGESAPMTLIVPAQEVILAAPAYGIQLGAMRRESGARALAEKTTIDPESLFIQASGS